MRSRRRVSSTSTSPEQKITNKLSPIPGPRRHEVISALHRVIEVLEAIVTTLGCFDHALLDSLVLVQVRLRRVEDAWLNIHERLRLAQAGPDSIHQLRRDHVPGLEAQRLGQPLDRPPGGAVIAADEQAGVLPPEPRVGHVLRPDRVERLHHLRPRDVFFTARMRYSSSDMRRNTGCRGASATRASRPDSDVTSKKGRVIGT